MLGREVLVYYDQRYSAFTVYKIIKMSAKKRRNHFLMRNKSKNKCAQSFWIK